MPASLVTPVYGTPRSTEFAVTVAPATAAPLESITVPVMVAVTSCAKVAFAPQSRNSKVTQQNDNATYFNFFITILPLRDPAVQTPERGVTQLRNSICVATSFHELRVKRRAC